MVAVLAIGGAVPVAADYGNSGGNVQLYQATASMNCNNVALCPAGLGGFWAWGEFNQDGTFSAEVTFCAHLQGPGGFNGAGHEHADGHYVITDFGLGPWIVISARSFVPGDRDAYARVRKALGYRIADWAASNMAAQFLLFRGCGRMRSLSGTKVLQTSVAAGLTLRLGDGRRGRDPFGRYRASGIGWGRPPP